MRSKKCNKFGISIEKSHFPIVKLYNDSDIENNKE